MSNPREEPQVAPQAPNRLARYVGNGRVEIVEEPVPTLPQGGLIVRTEACGLCSGELMDWYMDRKLPHVLGHEAAGIVEASDDPRFPVGARVFPHHHAPCGQCAHCDGGRSVHCPQWRRTKLVPGGMAERFAVAAENLSDTHVVDDLKAVDAALIEPLACVCKSVLRGGTGLPLVIGLGVMGLMHVLLINARARNNSFTGAEFADGVDLSEGRRRWASGLGLRALAPEAVADGTYDSVFVCPGSQAAFDLALRAAAPGATITMFAPLGPGEKLEVPQEAYFKEITVKNSYSAGPAEVRAAVLAIRYGYVRAVQVCSEFISLDELPEAYGRMKRGETLKPMVVFP